MSGQLLKALKKRFTQSRVADFSLPNLEKLEDRLMLAADLIISEFAASNEGIIADEDGDFEDWIEIHNAGDTIADLTGWSLTDDASELTKWTFPAESLAPGSFLVVYASGKDRAVADSELHTNFKLSANGEYLGLVEPDGITIKDEFTPEYPEQYTDVSYGVVTEDITLLGANSPIQYLIPQDDSLEPAWKQPVFDAPSLVKGSLLPSSTLVISEIGTGNTDFIEIQNASGSSYDATGHRVVVNHGASAPVTEYSDIINNEPDLEAYWRLGETVTTSGGGAPVVQGQDVIARDSTDSWLGHLANTVPLTDNVLDEGVISTWRIFNDNAARIGSQVTPLLLENVAGTYLVRGIGASQTVDASGLQQWDFDVQTGTDLVDLDSGTMHMGLRYGTPTVPDTGNIDFTTGGAGSTPWFFYGSANGVGVVDIVLNQSLGNNCCNGTLTRAYSAQFDIISTSGGLPVTAVDETGNHNGTYSNIGTSGDQSGAIINDTNTSVNFAGGKVTVPNAAVFDGAGGNLTIEAWVQPDVGGGWIVSKDLNNNAETPGLDYLLGLTGDNKFHLYAQGLDHHILSAPVTVDGQSWYHVVATQDTNTNTMSLYVNGELAASTNIITTGVTSNTDFIIGDRTGFGGNQNFDGRIDEVAVYSSALTPDNISEHYQAGLDLLVGGIENVNTNVWELNGLLNAGEVQYATDNEIDNYFGSDIRWDTSGPGWAMILDNNDQIVDFVSWGYSTGQLNNLTVDVDGVSITVGSQWTGAGIAPPASDAVTLQRQGDFDTDNAIDFTSQAPSMGTLNGGISADFQMIEQGVNSPLGYVSENAGNTTSETVGADLIDRALVDGASGGIFIQSSRPFTEAGTVTQWSMFSTTSRMTTPLLFELEGGSYRLRGVGESRTSNGSGLQTFDFNLQSGSADVDANYYFGWKDGNNTVNNAGVIDYDDTGADTMVYFGGGQAGNVVVGNGFDSGQSFGRAYSVQFTADSSLEDNFNSDIEALMYNQASTGYVRFPFNVTSTNFNSLTMSVRYDDAFVAYLNGTEVARSNFTGVPSFNAVADVDRPVELFETFENFDISSFMSLLTTGENVLAIHAINDSASSDEFVIDATLKGSRLGTPMQYGYFLEPSPGVSNGDSFGGFVGDTAFSIDRGFYSSPFDLEITSTTIPDADIYYTTDGSDPSPTNPNATLYNGPINISQTTTIRAAGFKDDFVPTNIDTHTYIFTSDVINQPNISSTIKNDPTWGPQLEDALKALPTISIVTGNSISQNEVGVSIEMINVDGTGEFQEDAGIEHFGGTSLGFAKKSMRVSFKSIYGAKKLNSDIYGSGVDEFDQILLRSGSHDTAFYTHNTGNRGIFIRNQWGFERQLEMGQVAPRGEFVHVYINGTYWGQYNLMERPNASFMADHLGGEKEDYDALNAGNPIDGTIDTWNALNSNLNDYGQLEQLLDIDNYIDYMLLNFYMGNDWDWNHMQNWSAATAKSGGDGFKFFTWDNDMMLRTTPQANVINRGGPGNMWGQIRQHTQIIEKMRDRAQELFFNGGILTTDRVTQSLNELKDNIELSIIAETARWGINGYTPGTLETEFNKVINNFVSVRTDIVIQQLKDAGILPVTNAPTFQINGTNQHGGAIMAGDMLTFTVENLPTFTESTLVGATNAASAIVPTSDILGNQWLSPSYVEGANGETWATGINGVGYELAVGNDYDPLINIDVEAGMTGLAANDSVYVRLPFNIASQSVIDDLDGLSLRILADDGFVAYLNGVEVASINDPAPLFYNSASTLGIEIDINSPTAYDIGVNLGDLLVGDNVLAIHGLNASGGSSDMLIHAQLIGLTNDPNPVPGNIFYTLDGSEPITNGIEYTGAFPLNTTTQVKARQFDNGQWSALNTAVFEVAVPLQITEIHYNPTGATQSEIDAGFNDGDLFEFIELKNVSDTITVDLNPILFNNGIDFSFAGSGVTSLNPGEYVLVVSNIAAFTHRYGNQAPDGTPYRIAGEFVNTNLNNGGDAMRLVDSFGTILKEFRYEDGRNELTEADWHPLTDGDGPSLTIADESEAADLGLGTSWRLSGIDGGSPGRPDATIGALAGDFNYDGIVNIADLAKLASNFNKNANTNPLLDIRWQHGDTNDDGVINIADLAKLASNFNKTQLFGGAAASSDLPNEANKEQGAILLNDHNGEDNHVTESWDHINCLLDDETESGII